MVSLEMLGYYSTQAHSQHYPGIISYFYPDKGNFVAFVSNFSSRELLRELIGTFRAVGRFPSEGLIAPRFLVPDIRRSDNSWFWACNYPAVMVTDTANFRNANYHRNSDTPDTLDYDSMARVVAGLEATLAAVADK